MQMPVVCRFTGMWLICSSHAVLRLFKILVPGLCVWLDFHCINSAVLVPVLGMLIGTHCDHLNGAVMVLVLGMCLA